MIQRRWGRALSALIVAAWLGVVLSGCTDGDVTGPQFKVEIFGWGPNDNGELDLVQGMPAFEEAAEVRAKVTRPAAGEVITEETGPVANRSVRIPEIPFGKGLRLELEVLNLAGETIASGATPVFDLEEGDEVRGQNMMVMPTNAFAKAGSIVRGQTPDERMLQQSRLDYRAELTLVEDRADAWLGRVGHAAVPTEDGKVLIVGGALVTPGSAPGTIPKFTKVYSDIQVFDPDTGYFTDLSYSDDLKAARPNGADRLTDERAYHTVTPLGEGRFFVAGGYTKLGDQTRPVRTFELIDLNASPGERVQSLLEGGLEFQTESPRGFHEAVYLEEQGQILLIGGVGETSDEILSTMQVVTVDGDNIRVVEQTFDLTQARTDHEAVALGDGSVWVMGGRDAGAAHDTTEIIEVTESGPVAMEGPMMNSARYGFAALVIEEMGGTRVLAIGGYTEVGAEAVSGTYEIGVKGVPEFIQGPSFTLLEPRGGLTALVLPQTQDVVIFGGEDAAGATISSVERLTFVGFAADLPYQSFDQTFGAFIKPRFGATFSMMTNGQVLVMGGLGEFNDGTTTALDSAELYNPRDPVGAR